MNRKNNFTPDELFESSFSNFEVPFEQAAWTDMLHKLETQTERRPFILFPFIHSKQQLNTLLAMITTGILAIFSFVATNNSNTATTKSTINSMENNKQASTVNAVASNSKTSNFSEGTLNSKTLNPKEVETFTSNEISASKGNKNNLEISDKIEKIITPSIKVKNETNTSSNSSNLFSTANADLTYMRFDQFIKGHNAFNSFKPTFNLENTTAGKLNNPLLQQTNPSKLFPKPNKYTMQNSSIGIYFTGQKPFQDSSTLLRRSFGFNIEVQSRNLFTSSNTFAAYVGVDWGMLWYGHTDNTIVAINTTNLDSGFTRLNMSSMDFLLNGKLELGTASPIHPYINGFIGPRLYFWQQYTESFMHLTDYENSSSNNAHTSATINYGIGGGVRVRLGNYVHLDARATVMKNSSLKMVDMTKSNFDGLKYNLVTKFHEPLYSQIRVGVIFELGDHENYNERNDNPVYNSSSTNNTTNNNNTNQQYLYYYVDSLGNPVKCVPCPCNCDSTKNTKDTGKYNYNSPSNNPSNKIYRVPVNINPGSGPVFGGSSSGNTSPSTVYKSGTKRGGSGPVFNSGSSSGSSRSSSSGSGKGSFPGIKTGGGKSRN